MSYLGNTMRRFPISWDKTLTSLGFRRYVKRIKQTYLSRRASRVEQLEARAMLTGSVVGEGTAASNVLSAHGLATQAVISPVDERLRVPVGLTMDALSRQDFQSIIGDADGDRKIDLLDLRVVGANWGKTGATPADGDVDGNGIVDRSDWSLIRAKIASSIEQRASTVAGKGDQDLASARLLELRKIGLEFSARLDGPLAGGRLGPPRIEFASTSALIASAGSQIGDVNGDGSVDLLDLDLLGSQIGNDSESLSGSDLNSDGVVDQLDWELLTKHYGAHSYHARVTSEPPLAALAASPQNPGDANGDGKADLLDMDILGANFGVSGATF
ncbi:MAG: dockerin type I domain-containing protein [Planctomycetota bacterium]